MLERYLKLLSSMYSLTARARSPHSPDLQTAVLMLGGLQYMNLLSLLFLASVFFGERSPDIPRWVFLAVLVLVYAVNALIASKNRKVIEERLFPSWEVYSKRPAIVYAIVSTCIMASVVVVMAVKLAMK